MQGRKGYGRGPGPLAGSPLGLAGRPQGHSRDNMVRLEKLVLEGFGPYREVVELHFSRGLNCYVARNEAGKSTLAAGLTATLFGLSHRQWSNTSLTLARFRNWHGPAHCRGEVTFSRGGQRYQVARDFDTHRVHLWQLGEGTAGKRLLVEGIHNPGGQKTLELYQDKLRELLGINSQELFRDTFWVEQPLPGLDQLGGDLQGLLAGGQGNPFSRALEALVGSLKVLTKYTGPRDRGVTRRNMVKEGRLEGLGRSIAGLEQEIARGRQAADSRVEVQERLLGVETRLEEKGRELKRQEETRRAWAQWQLRGSRYLGGAGERDKLEEAVGQARNLEQQLQQQERGLAENFPQFSQAPRETGERLAGLVNLEKQLREVREDISGWQETRLEEQAQLENLTLEEQGYAGWDLLGGDPVEKLKYIRRSGETCLGDWRQVQDLQGELEKIQGELQGNYRLFQEASPGERELARAYHRARGELAASLQEASQALGWRRERWEEYRAAREEFAARYADLETLPPGAEEAVQGTIQELQEDRQAGGAAAGMAGGDPGESPSRLPFKGTALRLGSAAFLAGLGALLVGTEHGVALALAVLLGALGGWWVAGRLVGRLWPPGGRKAGEKTPGARRESRERIAAYAEKLGPYAGAGEAELGSLAQRFQQSREEKRRLEALGGQSREEELGQLQGQREGAARRLEDFDRRMAPFTGAFPDVPAALGRWEWLEQEEGRRREELEAVVREKTGFSREELPRANPLGPGAREDWQEVARFLPVALPGADVHSLPALVGQLEGLPRDWWGEQEQKARQLAALRRELESARDRLAALDDRLAGARDREEKLVVGKGSLAENLGDILEASGGDPGGALGQWKQWQQEARGRDDRRLQLETLLENYQVKKVGELQGKLSRARDHAAVLLGKWQEHIEGHPGLPGVDQAGDPGELKSFLEELDAGIRQLSEEKSQLEATRNELSRQLAALEGESPLNIAAAELELEELRQQREELEGEARALVVAHQEMAAAINEYREKYQERLEQQATRYCQAICQVPHRQVTLDQDFNLGILEEGRPCRLEQLSKGARDQLYLALRFAVADLLAEEIKLPFIFDDPFTSSDAQRLENLRGILQQQARDRQLILLAHAPHFQDWGKPLAPTQAGPTQVRDGS